MVRLNGGPMGSARGLTWPDDVEWPEILWAGDVVTPDGQDAVMLSPVCQPSLHRYRRTNASSLSDALVADVNVIRGADYAYAPVAAPPDPDREAAGEYGPTPEDAP